MFRIFDTDALYEEWIVSDKYILHLEDVKVFNVNSNLYKSMRQNTLALCHRDLGLVLSPKECYLSHQTYLDFETNHQCNNLLAVLKKLKNTGSHHDLKLQNWSLIT